MLLAEQPDMAEVVDAVTSELNANPDALHTLLERQNYRLAFWRAAARDLGYRRFFDINTLVALRMEDEQVFADTHALVLRWLREGVLDGVRIDHPDGLRDPEAYCQRLHRAALQSWIVVEKILEPGEGLRDSWPVAGTTAYDFLNRVGGLFVDPDNRRPVDYELRRRLLHEVEGATPEQMWARVNEGLPKLWLIHQALALRRRRPELFGPQGNYQPLLARGKRAAHVVAFARGGGVVTVVPRLVLGLKGGWGDTTLKAPGGAWRNELTGADVAGHVIGLADVLGRFPVALLTRKEGM
jgi:maltooligosyltrehalose synthase